MNMGFESTNPFTERPPSLKQVVAEERAALERFRGRTARWLAAAMLLLTTEGCGAAVARGASQPEGTVCFNLSPESPSGEVGESPEPVCVPASEADAFRRANRLPVSPAAGNEPRMSDYLTSPDEEGARRPLLGVNPDDIPRMTREDQRQKAAEAEQRRAETIRKSRPKTQEVRLDKLRRQEEKRIVEPSPIKPPDRLTEH